MDQRPHIPKSLWEPAAGDGTIVRPLQEAGYRVVASDIADYGFEGCQAGVDYLTAKPPGDVEGIVTNPPFKLAVRFVQKAMAEGDKRAYQPELTLFHP